MKTRGGPGQSVRAQRASVSAQTAARRGQVSRWTGGKPEGWADMFTTRPDFAEFSTTVNPNLPCGPGSDRPPGSRPDDRLPASERAPCARAYPSSLMDTRTPGRTGIVCKIVRHWPLARR